MTELVYKIVAAGSWRQAIEAGDYLGSPADLRDGFIHLSAAHQVEGTAARHFAGVSDLLLVSFDASALGPALRWEASRGGELFPHLYAPLKTSLALAAIPMILDSDGVPRPQER